MGWPFAGVTSGQGMSTTIFVGFLACLVAVLLWGAAMWWRYRWRGPVESSSRASAEFRDPAFSEPGFAADGRREPAGLSQDPDGLSRVRFKDPGDLGHDVNVAHRPNPKAAERPKPRKKDPRQAKSKAGANRFSFVVPAAEKLRREAQRREVPRPGTQERPLPMEKPKPRETAVTGAADPLDASRTWPPVADVPAPVAVKKVAKPKSVHKAFKAAPPANQSAKAAPQTAVSGEAGPPARRGQSLRQILEPLGGQPGSITVGQQIVVRSMLGRPAPEWMSDIQARTLLSVRFCCEHILASVMGTFGDAIVDPVVLRRLTVLVVADKQTREQVVKWDAQRTLNSDGNPVFRQRDPKTVRMIERLARRLLDESGDDPGAAPSAPESNHPISASGRPH